MRHPTYVHVVSFDGLIIAIPSRFAYLRDGLKWLAKDYLQLPDAFIIR